MNWTNEPRNPQENTVILDGRLTRDPETRTVGENTVCKFTLAWNDFKKVGHFFDVECWRREAETAATFIKGLPVHVRGRLTQQRWTNKDGAEVSKAVIVAERVEAMVWPERAEAAPVAPPASAVPGTVAADDIPF